MIEPLPRRPAGPLAPLRPAVSPAALVGGAGGGAIAVIVGLPGVAAGAVAAVCWACVATVVAALRHLRSTTATDVDAALTLNPYTVPQPWRDLMLQLLHAQQQFVQTADATAAGPLKEYLVTLAEKVQEGVTEAWAIAERGTALGQAVARLDPGELRRRLAIVEAGQRKPPATGQANPSSQRTADTAAALRAQLETVHRLEAVAEDGRSRLQLLSARLGSAVAQAVELSVEQAPTALADDAGSVATSIDTVVGELATLRTAMAEADAAGGV